MNGVDVRIDDRIHTIIDKWEGKPSFLIEILQDVQRDFRYLPSAVLERISEILDVPLNKIYHIATFFALFSLIPQGKHIISVCTGTACHVKGARALLESFERELKVKCSETTEDMNFTLKEVRCLGCCGLAPVATVDEEVHGNLKTFRIPRMVKKYSEVKNAEAEN